MKYTDCNLCLTVCVTFVMFFIANALVERAWATSALERERVTVHYCMCVCVCVRVHVRACVCV